MEYLEPTLTVILPVFNEGAHIEKTLLSVLSQTYSDIQVLVGDNCSTDNSWEIISKIACADKRVIPVRQKKNIGAVANVKSLVSITQSPYVAFIGAHDVLDPEWAKILMSYHGSDFNNFSLVYSRTLWIGSTGKAIRETDGGAFNTMSNSSIDRFLTCISRSWGECTAVNGIFQGSILRSFSFPACTGPDHILLARASFFGKIYCVDQPLYYRREFSRLSSYYERVKGSSGSFEDSSLSCQMGAYIAETFLLSSNPIVTLNLLSKLPKALFMGYNFRFIKLRTGPVKALGWSILFLGKLLFK